MSLAKGHEVGKWKKDKNKNICPCFQRTHQTLQRKTTLCILHRDLEFVVELNAVKSHVRMTKNLLVEINPNECP